MNPLYRSKRLVRIEKILAFLHYRAHMPRKWGIFVMKIAVKHFVEPEIKAKRKEVEQAMTKKVYNPMYSLPVNGLCVCGSGIKLKKCCLRMFPRAVYGQDYLVIQKMIEKGNHLAVRGVSRETKTKKKIEIVKG